MKRRYPWRAGLLAAPELLLLLVIVAAGIHLIYFVASEGYLPQPFIWDPTDTFMDWFNPAYWANHEGVYTAWRSIYPPLSFAMLRALSIPGCYVSSPYAGRDCDSLGIAAILVFYVVSMIAAFMAIRRQQPRVAIVRGLALAIGYPGLFVLERGNLLIPCFLAFVLAYGGLVTGRTGRAIAVALTINFKPYLVLPAFAWALKREWRLLELAGIATIAIYLISWAIVGSGSLPQILSNLTNWITVTGGDVVAEVYYTTSFNSVLGVLNRGFGILQFVGSKPVEAFVVGVKILMFTAQGLGVLALVATWLQPHAATAPRLATILLLLSLTNQSPGGYTELFVVFLVFLEPWHRVGPIIAIICCYLISIPFDVVIAKLPLIHTGSWLTGEAINGQFGVAAGQFLRPLGLLMILAALALDTIFSSIRAHKVARPQLGLATPDIAKAMT